MKLRKLMLIITVCCAIPSVLAREGQLAMRIACVGDDATFGTNLENREADCHPAQLSKLLGSKHEVANFGKTGAALPQKGTLPYKDSSEHRKALRFNPDLVLINLGFNDAKPQNRVFLKEFAANYKDLISSFQKLPARPRVVVLSPAPVFSDDGAEIAPETIEHTILPLVKQVAYETGCEILDLYHPLSESPEYFPDKLHPSAAGASVIARRVSEFIQMKSDLSFDISKIIPAKSKKINFHGFQGYEFSFKGRKAVIVAPKRTAPRRPWVWCARFFSAPQTTAALLERGFHVAHLDVAEMFGNARAISLWDAFYLLLQDAGLSQKSVMIGISRGGVYVYRWASTYPGRVAAVYADAPVLDLKSWPGGKGKSKKGNALWETFKKDFGLLSEAQAMAFNGNPLDLTEKIARAGFPLLHVVGDADETVPVEENTAPFEQKILKSGGNIKVIHKPGIGHHPHGLKNPKPVVDFILQAVNYHDLQKQ